MLTVFGHQVVHIQCVNGLGTPEQNLYLPCIDTHLTYLGNMDVSKPQVLFSVPLIGGLQPARVDVGRPAARPEPDDDAARRPGLPGPEQQGPAPARPVPAPDLDPVRRVPAGRPVHLLDRHHDLRDRPAVPHRRMGCHVPVLRMDPRLRPGPSTTLPRRAADAALRAAGRLRVGDQSTTPSSSRTEADRTASAAATVRPRERGRQGRRGRKR